MCTVARFRCAIPDRTLCAVASLSLSGCDEAQAPHSGPAPHSSTPLYNAHECFLVALAASARYSCRRVLGPDSAPLCVEILQKSLHLFCTPLLACRNGMLQRTTCDRPASSRGRIDRRSLSMLACRGPSGVGPCRGHLLDAARLAALNSAVIHDTVYCECYPELQNQ